MQSNYNRMFSREILLGNKRIPFVSARGVRGSYHHARLGSGSKSPEPRPPRAETSTKRNANSTSIANWTYESYYLLFGTKRARTAAIQKKQQREVVVVKKEKKERERRTNQSKSLLKIKGKKDVAKSKNLSNFTQRNGSPLLLYRVTCYSIE